jgi:hypothetical protein
MSMKLYLYKIVLGFRITNAYLSSFAITDYTSKMQYTGMTLIRNSVTRIFSKENEIVTFVKTDCIYSAHINFLTLYTMFVTRCDNK